jgi:hypothetical protein
MTHSTIKQALQPDEIAKLNRVRFERELIPPPNYDIAITIYEREADGTDSENPLISFDRPQDFATRPNMQYQYFGVMTTFKTDGGEFMVNYLVHLYWDGNRDSDSARELILSNPDILSYGEWTPTAPSDPLQMDDFWEEELGEPPHGMWNHWFDDETPEIFKAFNNFERPPYLKID